MYSDDVRQHLAFIQGVISRMNSNSFSMKGWMVAIVSAMMAVYASNANTSASYVYIIAAIASVIIFCFLDAYYLKMEKQYRDLYHKVLENRVETDFVMDANCFKRTIWEALRSSSIWILYSSVFLLLSVALFLVVF